MTFLRDTGECLLSPVRGEHEEQYKTWSEMARAVPEGTQQLPDIDGGLSHPRNYIGQVRCVRGCKKVFQSVADRERHDKLIHRLQLN